MKATRDALAALQAALAAEHAAVYGYGVAGAMLNVTQQVGGAIGIAMLNTIALSAASNYVSAHPDQPGAVALGNVHSYIVAFWWGAAIFAIGAVVTRLLLPKHAAAPAEGSAFVHH